MAVNDNVAGAVAIYDPNGPLAIIAFLCFGFLSIALWTKYYRTRPRAKYMRLLSIGTTFMSIGFICRFSRRNGINAWSWLFETLCILLSPCAFIAQVYILAPRLAIFLNADDELPMARRAMTIIFILADFTTVISQLAGTALTITFGNLVSIGQKLLTASLWVQLAFFASFVLLFAVFAVRIRHEVIDQVLNAQRKPMLHRWTTLNIAIWLVCGLMAIRSIYRVAEYTAGASSSLGQSEAAFYVLDTVPMLLFAATLLLVWPPNSFDEDHAASSAADVSMKKFEAA